MSTSLKGKALKGAGWSFLDNLAGAGITFFVGLILARILSPDEFGIIGMITIFIALSNSIIDSGFSNALIRKIDSTNLDYNTVFFFNLLVSLLLYAILFFSSPLISDFFNETKLVEVTKVVGLVLIFNAFGIIQRTLLVKEVDFKTQTKVSVIASVGSGIIGITLAILGFGVWSLVMQQVSRQFLNSAFLWFFNSWRPRLEFSFLSFKEMFGFGSKLMVSGIINTLFQNIYYLVIGKFYSATDLGYYTRAEQFKTIFSRNLTVVVQRVSYPVLSSIQNEEERLVLAYRKVIKSTMLVTFLLMLGMAAVAKPMIVVLIGEKWLNAAEFLQIMCFAGMLYPLNAINLNILQVKGRSDLFLKLEIYKKMLATIPITMGIFLGIKFLLFGSIFTSVISFLLNANYSSKLIDYPVSMQVKDILPYFLVSLLIAILIWLLVLLPFDFIIILLLQLTVGLLIGFLLFESLKLTEYIELKAILISFLKRKFYER